MSIAEHQEGFRPIHRAKLVASFALLGAVLAGVCGLVFGIDVLNKIDLHAIGAGAGAVFGIVGQVFRR